MRRLAATFLTAGLFLATKPADAAGPYVVLVDDGTIANSPLQTEADLTTVQTQLLALYKASGFPLPQIMSVWTTFPLGGGIYSTIFDPLANDVKGIGLEGQYGGDGTFKSPNPPLQSILLHNDVLDLPTRAAKQGAPLAGFGRYLFLLELSHNWGPALNVPGATPTELVGFPFHWSFFMDSGGSPAGGNVWKDNGDGTFTAVAADPATLAYSKLDLYNMGLLAASDVPPFGVLENVTAPATIMDPLWGGVYAAHSFPWFSAGTTFTATATRRMLTIQDIVTTNGARSPAFGASPTSFTLAIVLVVGAKDSASTIASAEATLDPLSSSFAPAFHDATGQRGTLVVVTEAPDAGVGDAGEDAAGTGGASSSSSDASSAASSGSAGGSGMQPASPSSSGCACHAAASAAGESSLSLLALAGIAMGSLRALRRPRKQR